jgi:hypothetical protein
MEEMGMNRIVAMNEYDKNTDKNSSFYFFVVLQSIGATIFLQ